MRTFIQLAIIAVVLFVATIFLFCFFALQEPPLNWTSNLLTKNREEIESLLGKPGGDFAAKDFLAWESFSWWGRQELRVEGSALAQRERRPDSLDIDLSIGAQSGKEYFAFIKKVTHIDSKGQSAVVLFFPKQIGSYVLYRVATALGLIPP